VKLGPLALGEIVGFGIPITLATRKTVPTAGFGFTLNVTARSILVVLGVYLATAGTYALLPGTVAGFFLAAVVGGAASLLAMWFVGLESSRRAHALQALRARL
jgi:hypothetical protein